MPTYEYKNIETGEIYEFKQSMRDDALTRHPETGAAIKRIVSLPGIAFKGSGFYANDSRASSSSARSGGETTAAAEKPAGTEKPASTSAGESSPALAKPAEPAPVKSAPAAVKSGE